MSKLVSQWFGTEVTAKIYNKAVPLTNPDPSLIYGVELEIESAQDYTEWGVSGIAVKDDNSLRNFGKEFVTSPMTYSNLAYALKLFFKKAKLSEENYSERTSVHVHANCNDMTLPQVASVLLLYSVFERLFYIYAGGDRDKNIFCVPWHETTLSYNYISKIAKEEYGNVRTWQKYTGLNVLPLQKYGTIEFRHLPGTCDLDKILTWCKLIGHLFAYAKTHSFEETRESVISLNTTSAYSAMFDSVFQENAHVLKIPGYESVLEDGVLSVKFAAMQQTKKKNTSVNTSADFATGVITENILQPARNSIFSNNVRPAARVPAAAQRELDIAPLRNV